jgi:hypothetical protein
VEWNASGKANAFVDKRIGENVVGLTPEEKQFARFTKQQTRQLAKRKKAKFNVEDDSDGEAKAPQLTHAGRALSDELMMGAGGGGDDSSDEGAQQRARIARGVVAWGQRVYDVLAG